MGLVTGQLTAGLRFQASVATHREARSRALFEAARDLLQREIDGTRFRLIGVGVGELCDAQDADHGDLVDTRAARDKATEAAVDSLRARFGGKAVVKGIAFGPKPRER